METRLDTAAVLQRYCLTSAGVPAPCKARLHVCQWLWLLLQMHV